jgi:tripartite-type tricarboxylate transporter receptor subunit TctC
MKRKFAKCLLLGFLAFGSSAEMASAQFPERPLRIILPFGAGGNGDITAPILAEILKDVLGQSVLVENLPGPGGMAAARGTLSAPRDGHTLTWLHSGTATGSSMMSGIKAQ